MTRVLYATYIGLYRQKEVEFAVKKVLSFKGLKWFFDGKAQRKIRYSIDEQFEDFFRILSNSLLGQGKPTLAVTVREHKAQVSLILLTSRCSPMTSRCNPFTLRYNPMTSHCDPMMSRCYPLTSRCNPMMSRCNPMTSLCMLSFKYPKDMVAIVLIFMSVCTLVINFISKIVSLYGSKSALIGESANSVF